MMERRFVKGAQVRAKKGDKPGIEGYAAVFGDEYVLYQDSRYKVVERIKPGAFTKVIGENQDTRCLFNHSADNVLGRTTNKTLRYSQDDKGLAFENDLDMRTTTAQNVQAYIDRGDVTGCSFAFTVSKQSWRSEMADDMEVSTREIEEIDELFDVGPVTYPAYSGTTVGARAEIRSLLLQMPGLPTGLRSIIERDEQDDADEEMACRCQCRACYSGECNECDKHMQSCGDDENCVHSSSRSARAKRGGAVTKRVDSEDLTAKCFIYVGDVDKTETWSLPWKFSTDAKTKSHLRNALARFNQTENIPADKKPAAWKKLVRICKKNGIKVTDTEAKSWALTTEQRSELRGESVGGGNNCQCNCDPCMTGDCDNCNEPGCDDPECQHSGDDDRAAQLMEIDARMRTAGLKPAI